MRHRILICVSFALAACNSSGSDGERSNVAFNGSESPGIINTTNYKSVASGVLRNSSPQVFEQILDVARLLPYVKDHDDRWAGYYRSGLGATKTPTSVRGGLLQTINNSCQYAGKITGSFLYKESPGTQQYLSGSGPLTFNECDTGSYVYTGDTNVEGKNAMDSEHGDLGQSLTLKLGNLTTIDTADAANSIHIGGTINETIAYYIAGVQTGSRRITYRDVVIAHGETADKLSALTLNSTRNETNNTYEVTIEGEVAVASMGGSVMIKTESPLVLPSEFWPVVPDSAALEATAPMSGAMSVTGNDNATVRLEFLASGLVRVRLDANGDHMDEEFQDITWQALMGSTFAEN